MKYKLGDICEGIREKILTSDLSEQGYISTDNMIVNRGGIIDAVSLPSSKKVQSFKCGDVLVSNIRPYFKKIWHATFDGGCSNDVLVFRAKRGISGKFLYYTLSDDAFFSYAMSTAKGTKMPRGDKEAIMDYPVDLPSYELQEKRVILPCLLDELINYSNQINKNLYVVVVVSSGTQGYITINVYIILIPRSSLNINRNAGKRLVERWNNFESSIQMAA